MSGALSGILLRPRTILSLAFMLLIGGIYSYITIAKDARPDIQVPVFHVSMSLSGLSPEDAERLLARPMEDYFRNLEGLDTLTTISSHGYAAAVIEFESGTDLLKAGLAVRDELDLVRVEVPEETTVSGVNEVNLSLIPTILVVMSGDIPERSLYRQARLLRDRIEALPSVLSVDVSGVRDELLEIIIDTQRLESYGISYLDLERFVASNNRVVAAGDIDDRSGRFAVKVTGLFKTASDVINLPIKVEGDRVVTLGEIAEIRQSFSKREDYARFNGRPAVTLSVVKRIGSNIIENNGRVREIVSDFSLSLPSGLSEKLKIDVALDESTTIEDTLSSLESAIFTAISMVIFVCIAALGVRSALLVGLAIPCSFIISFLFADLSGRVVNNMMMFGMLLTVGILVDSAIVIVEYADRKISEGLSRGRAFLLSTVRMFWPIVASTATTLAAFLPLLFWPGIPGEFMSNLPITVIIVLSASLLVALFLIPVIGRLGDRDDGDSDVSDLVRAPPVSLSLLRSSSRILDFYVGLLERLIRRPIIVTLGAVLIGVTIIYSYVLFGYGTMFFVDTEESQAISYIRGRGNMSLDEQLALGIEVERIIGSVRDVESVSLRVGDSGGFGSDGGRAPRDTIGSVTLELRPYADRRPSAVVYDDIRARTSSLAGIIVETSPLEGGPPTGKDIRLQILSDNWLSSELAARRVRSYMETGMDGLTDIEDSASLPGIEWRVGIDREDAGRYGADLASLGSLLQMMTHGAKIGTYRPDDADDEVDIRVRLPEDLRSLSEFDRMRLQTSKGLVPVSNFTYREAYSAVDVIERSDGRNSVFVQANVVSGILPNDKIGELRDWLSGEDFPSNVSFEFRGGDEEQQESFSFLLKAMFVSIFLMFIILVTQFNSFYHAVITLSTVLMSVLGVLLGLLITGQAFSVIMTGTGIVALAGIVVNNAIVLIDTYHRFLSLGGDVVESVLHACAQRLRPVFLTTVTTVCGLFPMALEINVGWLSREIGIGSVTSSWWVQLATAIISGLSFATVLTLILCPVWLAAPTVIRRRFSAYGLFSRFSGGLVSDV